MPPDAERPEPLDPQAILQEDWHAVDVSEAVELLDTRAEGLDDDEAAARREAFGPNKLPSQ